MGAKIIEVVDARGVDISKWQGDVDFIRVKASGVQFVILRAAAGTNVDKKFMQYVNQCKVAGIQIDGVYVFSYALTPEQAQKEAMACIANVEKAGLGKDIIIFFDFEYDTVKSAAAKGIRLTKDDCMVHTRVFCDYVKSQGYKAGIYSNIDYYKNWYTDKKLLADNVFWLADYTGGPNYSCAYQQYSSKGRVDGIDGNVDMNYRYKKISTATSAIPDIIEAQSKLNANIRMGQIHANNFVGKQVCEPDGIRGPKTKKAAAMVLQTAMNLDYNVGLKVDGDIGPKSRKALSGHYVQYGETQYMVTALEILLMLTGVDAGLELPGIYGENLKRKMGTRVDENKFLELIG